MSLAERDPGAGRTRAQALISVRGPIYRWDSAGWGALDYDVSHVFATREVTAIAGIDQFGAADRRELIEQLLHSTRGMLAATGGQGRGSALELRYVAEPQSHGPTRVRLFLTAKGSGVGDSATARGVGAAVESACSHLPRGFQWEEPSEVDWTFPQDSALYEVRKQEMLIAPTLRDVPTNFYYVVHPLGGNGRGWAQFGQVLADVTERVVVSLLFAPTSVDSVETASIDRIVTMLEYYGNSRQVPDVFGNMEQVPPDGGAASALPLWRGYQSALTHSLLARATVVGQREAAQVVAKALAAATSLTDQEGTSVPPVTQRPKDDQSVSSAMHSLGFLDVVPWGGHPVWADSDAPHSLRRLPYLYGLAEAAALAVLPVPDDQGAPGFSRARRVVTRRMAPIRTEGDSILLGELKHEGRVGGRAHLPLSAVNRHLLVVGAPGSGKTMTVLSMLARLWSEHRIPFLAIEPTKTEYRSLLDVPGFDDLRIVTFGRDDIAPIRLNPLAPPPGVRAEAHMSSLMAAFRAALPLDPPLPQLLEAALERCYERAGWDFETTLETGGPPPTLRDLMECYEQSFGDLEYQGEIRATLLAAVKVRLGSLMKGTRGRLLDTVESIDFAALMSRPIVVEMDEVADPDDKAILAAFVLDRIRAAARARGSGSQLRHVTVLEEAHRLLSKQGAAATDSPRAAAIRSFCEAIAELRALGEGFIISSQSPSALAEAAVSNTGTKILHRLESAADREVVLSDVDATEDERKAAARLGRGEAVVKWPQLDELEFVSVSAPAGVDSGRPVSNEYVRARMEVETAAIRRLLPYRLCTREVCTQGCDHTTRNLGSQIAREVSDGARELWKSAGTRTIDALAPIAKAIKSNGADDQQQAYCAAVHLAVRGDAFARSKAGDIRAKLAKGIQEAMREGQ